MTALDDALSLPALTVDGRDLSVAAAAAAALYLSELSAAERRAQEGAACLASGDELLPPESEVRDAAAAFRRERRLLSAEEMEAWLARRGLSAGVWMAWVRADVARRRAADAAALQEAEPGEVAAGALWAEALCSGALARAARRLAELLVAPEPTDGDVSRHTPMPPDEAPLRTLGVDLDEARAIIEQLPARESAVERLAERVASPEAIAERVRARQTDWLSVDYRALAVTEEPAAREVLLCVRDDGMPLDDVAQLAGADVGQERILLEDAPTGLHERLLSACPGDLIGPLARDGQTAILIVDGKESPSPDDPDVSRRAGRELIERALEAEMTTRVRWHDRL